VLGFEEQARYGTQSAFICGVERKEATRRLEMAFLLISL